VYREEDYQVHREVELETGLAVEVCHRVVAEKIPGHLATNLGSVPE
jgi:hypothetical protein